jgi:3-(3-hydroxy-phenyl)propionate hydroxylase
VYLVRPDQHVAARWRTFDEEQVRQAMCRALKLA